MLDKFVSVTSLSKDRSSSKIHQKYSGLWSMSHVFSAGISVLSRHDGYLLTGVSDFDMASQQIDRPHASA